MDRRLIAVLPCFWLWLGLGTSSLSAEWSCVPQEPACRAVFIVHNSWHAAIVLNRDDLSIAALPELADFPNARFVEFSWGDRDFFTDPKAGVWAALRAAFWSAGSVVHLVGFSDSVASFYRGAEITELRLAPGAFQLLIDFLSKAFTRSVTTARALASPGLFAYSRFYPAAAHFSLFRTCNTWVAEALAAAGIPISPAMVLTAASLASQIDALAKSN